MVTMARRQLWQARSLHGEEIAKRHAAAAELVRDGQARVAPVADSLLPSWSVKSGADSSQLHQVEQEHRQCPELGCRQRCQDCGACVHHFRCSCPDWMSHKLICKHVHLVCMLTDDLGLSHGPSRELNPQATEPNPQATESLPGPADDLPLPSRPASKQRLLAELTAVMALAAALPEGTGSLFSAAVDKVAELRQLLNAVPLSAGVTSDHQLPETEHRPWNARIEPQPCFKSRRAKRPRVQSQTVHADSAAARELVGDLSRGDAGRDRVPQAHQDHTY